MSDSNETEGIEEDVSDVLRAFDAVDEALRENGFEKQADVLRYLRNLHEMGCSFSEYERGPHGNLMIIDTGEPQDKWGDIPRPY